MFAPVLALLFSLFLGIATSAPTKWIQIKLLNGTLQVTEVNDNRKITPQKVDMLVNVLGVAGEYVPQEVKEFLADMTDDDKAQLASFVNDVHDGTYGISESRLTNEVQALFLREEYPAVYARGKKLYDQLRTKFGRLSLETKIFILKSVEALQDLAKKPNMTESGPEKMTSKMLDLYKETFANYASAEPIVRTDVEREWPELHRLFTSEKVLQNVNSMQQLIATQENLKKQMEDRPLRQEVEA